MTGQLIVGMRAASGAVNEVTSVPANFPPHVVEAAKVGISDTKGCDIDLTCHCVCSM